MSSNSKFDMIITYYKNELDLKNREINSLKKANENLKLDNKKLNEKIELMKFENYKVKELYGTKMTLEFEKMKKNGEEINNSDQYQKEIKQQTPFSFCNKCLNYKTKLYDFEILNSKYEELIKQMTLFYNRINKIFNNNNNNNNITLKFNKNTNFEEFKKYLNQIENGIFSQYGDGGNINQSQNNQFYTQRDNNRLFFPYKI